MDAERLSTMDAANEYWHIVKEIPHDDLSYRGKAFQPTAYGRLWNSKTHTMGEEQYPTRDELVKRYSWAIPSPKSLRFILDHLDGQGIIEIGAGTGYWAAMLTLGGADVVAFDKYPPDKRANWYHSEHEKYWHTITQEDVDEYNERWGYLDKINSEMVELTEGTEHPFPRIPLPNGPKVGDRQERSRPREDGREIFFPVEEGSIEKLVQHLDRVLLLSWPPYDKPLATDALKAFPGDTLIYIGEGAGGCCADDDFFDLLDREWVEDETLWNKHPSWSGINDCITVYRRKS